MFKPADWHSQDGANPEASTAISGALQASQPAAATNLQDSSTEVQVTGTSSSASPPGTLITSSPAKVRMQIDCQALSHAAIQTGYLMPRGQSVSHGNENGVLCIYC